MGGGQEEMDCNVLQISIDFVYNLTGLENYTGSISPIFLSLGHEDENHICSFRQCTVDRIDSSTGSVI